MHEIVKMDTVVTHSLLSLTAHSAHSLSHPPIQHSTQHTTSTRQRNRQSLHFRETSNGATAHKVFIAQRTKKHFVTGRSKSPLLSLVLTRRARTEAWTLGPESRGMVSLLQIALDHPEVDPGCILSSTQVVDTLALGTCTDIQLYGHFCIGRGIHVHVLTAPHACGGLGGTIHTGL